MALLFLLFIHLFLLFFLRFTAWPEMTLWPYLLNQDLSPYRDIVVVYPPVLLGILGVLGKLFGISVLGLKIYTWFVILGTDLLIFFVAKKLTGVKTAFLALGFYIFWQPYFEGNGLWFDLAITPLGLLIFYFLWNKKFFLAGLVFGLALGIKQTALYFLIPMVAMMILEKGTEGTRRGRGVIRLIWGVALAVFPWALFLFAVGLLPDFYQWAIKFGVFYLPSAPGQVELPTVKQLASLIIPYCPIVIIASLFLIKKNLIPQRKTLATLMLWCLFGTLSAYSRWSFFHLQPSLPFLAIIFGIMTPELWAYLRQGKAWLSSRSLNTGCFASQTPGISLSLISALSLFILFSSFYLVGRFYRLNLQKPDRFVEKDVLEMADWLKQNTASGEKIYLLNSWDHLYALSGTLPAVSPLIHTLPWHLEYSGMQEKYVADLEKNKPRIVIFEEYAETGLGSYRPEKIDKFVKENYTFSGKIANRFSVLRLK